MAANNKRIVINTLIVYIRVIIIAIIGFISSRFVLEILGFDSYGLYNVVGGIIGLFSFISGSLSLSTQRFLNIELGKVNGDLNKVFNVSFIIHVFFALIVLFIAEILGIYYIKNFLNISQTQINDALFIFQVSTLSACISIIAIPFQSLLLAFEKFFILAITEITANSARLILILLLYLYDGDILRAYSLIICAVTIAPMIVYYFICRYSNKEIIRFKVIFERNAYKDVLFFNNYNLLTTVSLILRTHGSVLIINYFYGLVVNAAYAISNTVYAVVNTFVAQFDTATAPQITQNISLNNSERSVSLTVFTCRICLLLLAVIYFPLNIELEFIIGIWLGEYPEDTIVFCRYTLLLAIASASSAGISKLLNAIGDIKAFSILYSLLYFSCLPFGILCFKLGLPAYSMLIMFIVVDIILRAVQFIIIRKNIGVSIRNMVKNAYLKCIYVYISSYIVSLFLMKMNFYPIVNILLCAVSTIILIYTLGISKNERAYVVKYSRKK